MFRLHKLLLSNKKCMIISNIILKYIRKVNYVD